MGVKTLSFKDGIEEWIEDITPDADKVGLKNNITITYTNRDPESGAETTVTTSVNNTQSALEILNNANTAQEGNLNYLNNNMGDMRKADYGDPVTTDHGGTGNKAGYIRTGHNGRSDIGSNCTIEGLNNAAPGMNSHAEGEETSAMGVNSHAEGYKTCARGRNAHSEGGLTKAIDNFSHAEGIGTTAGYYGHSEGYYTSAGYNGHAEGYETCAGFGGHTEGFFTKADSDDQLDQDVAEEYGGDAGSGHAEGHGTTAYGVFGPHAEGMRTKAIYCAHAEGVETYAQGYSATTIEEIEIDRLDPWSAHAEGYRTTAKGKNSHAEGENTCAVGIASHTEGENTRAAGIASHAEGYHTYARGDYSHAEGESTTAYGRNSYAGGYRVLANDYDFMYGGIYNEFSTADQYYHPVFGWNGKPQQITITNSYSQDISLGDGGRTFDIDTLNAGSTTTFSTNGINKGQYLVIAEGKNSTTGRYYSSDILSCYDGTAHFITLKATATTPTSFDTSGAHLSGACDFKIKVPKGRETRISFLRIL